MKKRTRTKFKTFKDLLFDAHPVCYGGVQARLDFKNGYGVSVINGSMSYTNGPNEFELAVFKGGNLCYDTPITDDVLGHLSAKEVTEAMKKVQRLRRKK